MCIKKTETSGRRRHVVLQRLFFRCSIVVWAGRSRTTAIHSDEDDNDDSDNDNDNDNEES